MLNGEIPDVMDVNYQSDFERARYAIVLLAAMGDPIFEDDCIQVQNSKYFSFYKLKKIAKFCHLKFERGKTAKKKYQELKSKERVRFLIRNNHTFITLTKIGQKIYRKRLKHFINLKLHTSIQNQLVEEKLHTISTSVAKGVKIKPRRLTKMKPIFEKLESMRQVTGDNHQDLIQI
jgi:thymidylate synthase ThyX